MNRFLFGEGHILTGASRGQSSRVGGVVRSVSRACGSHRESIHLVAAAGLLAAALAACAGQPQASGGGRSSNAPPPPRVVFVEEPEIVVVPGTRVYMVSESGFGYDMFRYGSSWYLYSGGFWYRSSSYRGSFAVIDVRSVPSPIMKVPASRWKHHPHGGPPGQMKAKKRGGPAA